jgi:hypothetical protein
MSKNQTMWTFKKQEERDDLLEKVFVAAESQDISRITSL